MVSRRTALVFLALAATSCLSPTLPLPPPSKPDVEGPDQQGMVILDGTSPEPGAAIIAWNHRTGEIRGQITDQSAHYRFSIGADLGDTMELWYTIGEEKSPSLVFIIEAP
jgi:hypothetical protein